MRAVSASTSRKPVSGPSQEDIQAAQQLSAADRQDMIDGMVDRLAHRLEQDPRDQEGWIRLARSRQVQGREEDARAALRRALGIFADEPAVQAEIRDAAQELAIGLDD